MTATVTAPPAVPPVEPRFSPHALARRLGEREPTPEQALAVAAPLGPWALVAGAGSGKTQTMGMRVVWLVANGLVEPHRVLGLTFTRKAAAELATRVRRLLGALLGAHDRAPFLDEAVALSLRTGEPTVSTYHAYAAGLVGEHALRVGLEPSARLLGEAVTWQYAARVVEGYDGPMGAVDKSVASVTADVLGLAAELAEHLRAPHEVAEHGSRLLAHLEALPRGEGQRTRKRYPPALGRLVAVTRAREQLLPLVEAYTARKRARNAIDHGDQVALAARIAREHPVVGLVERDRYAAVLLDEYQDTGESQRVLLQALFGGGHAVTAVGDPRQAIYGWRGASAGNLERFPDDFRPPGLARARSGDLSVSFRNGERILAVANRVAAAIPVRGVGAAALRPGPGRERAGRVEVSLHDTVETEAAWVADRIASLSGRVPWGEVAVLARRRALLPRVEARLRERRVPCEVVGLGGLLLQPEVLDVVAALRVVADPAAGNALMRLLTGPGLRIGPRDLDALGRRARALARPGDPAGAAAPALGPVAERSIVDALDDPGDAGAYSPDGYRRLGRFGARLRHLRSSTAQPLPDLVSEIVRVLDLDVELAARPAGSPADARVHLDRLVEVAEDFAAAGDDAGALAFLAYLDAASRRERGLQPEPADPDADRVQLLTVHAAKGLEWDAVFVVGMSRSVFPAEGRAGADWARQAETLPFPLRGDAADLPDPDLSAVRDQLEAEAAVASLSEACVARSLVEERRLGYVALTRARELLVCTAAWWDTATRPRGPSRLLLEVREACAEHGGPTEPWAEAPPDDAVNPLTAEPAQAPWPDDPLGGHRAAIAAGAGLVRAADHGKAAPPTLGGQPDDRWAEEVSLLLAEQAAREAGGQNTVTLGDHLSVSQLVLLRSDPAELARQVRRPLPSRPRPAGRRGTGFHRWLEQVWGQQRLLDLDDLPGAADTDDADDARDLATLQEAFRAGPWWGRAPVEVELPFEMVVEGVAVRGRVDAVFRADTGYEVVDWKTGRRPRGAEAAAAAVQLAAYRLAWADLAGVPVAQVRAAFHYVREGTTMRPVDLLDAEGLAALIRSVPPAGG